MDKLKRPFRLNSQIHLCGTRAAYHSVHTSFLLSGSTRVALSSSRLDPGLPNQGPTHPTLRANPFPEVTDLFCRLPLSTLFYQLEAVHLGDLLRLWVRLGVRVIRSLGFSRAVQTHPTRQKCRALPAIEPYLRANRFQGGRLLNRTENSSQGLCRRLQVHLRCRQKSTSGFRNINRIPFR